MTLDCACGVGYGSDILAEKSAKVIGVDYDETAIKTARNTYTRNNIEFRIENIADLSFPDSYFNTIVSLETLEHVPFELSKLFLSNAAGWLCNVVRLLALLLCLGIEMGLHTLLILTM